MTIMDDLIKRITRINGKLKREKDISKSDISLMFNLTKFLHEDASLSERFYCIKNNITEPVLCPICNINPVKWGNFKYRLYCSRKCSSDSEETQKKRENTLLIETGYDNPTKNPEVKERIKNTCIEKYGVDNPAKNDIIKEKVKITNKEKYGYEHHMKNPDVIENRRILYLEKYGYEHHMHNPDVIKNRRILYLEKTGYEHHMKNPDVISKMKYRYQSKTGYPTPLHNHIVREKQKIAYQEKTGYSHNFENPDNIDKSIKTRHKNYIFKLDERLKDGEWLVKNYIELDLTQRELSNKLNIAQSTVGRHLKLNNIKSKSRFSVSSIERDIVSFIETLYDREVIINTRKVISPLELDIYIPEKKLAIELNGVYWHSSAYKDKNYHLTKTIECEKIGIQLLHIFDFEWIKNNDIWKSVIANKLGVTSNRIYARKCTIKEVSVQDGFLFFNENHLQGGLSKGKHVGLYMDQELVSCISYGASRFKKDEIEIYRFANKLNTNVVGGFSKLLKQIKHKEIISYANRRWSTGNVYSKNGFELVDETPPNYFYYKNGEFHSRHKFQKHKLKSMLSYDELKTEEQIMDEEGYLRIYDCGNLKYVYKGK